jgi:hypothetical protein
MRPRRSAKTRQAFSSRALAARSDASLQSAQHNSIEKRAKRCALVMRGLLSQRTQLPLRVFDVCAQPKTRTMNLRGTNEMAKAAAKKSSRKTAAKKTARKGAAKKGAAKKGARKSAAKKGARKGAAKKKAAKKKAPAKRKTAKKPEPTPTPPPMAEPT